MSNQHINSCVEKINLPVENVQAIQSTRLSSKNSSHIESPYDYFNLGLHVKDNPAQVIKNREKLLSFFPNNTQIQWLEQVHGSDVEVIESVEHNALVADAIVTSTPNIALAIMTADCLPILLTNGVGTEVAAIHGGWRPLAENIIKKTLAKMCSNNSEIHAWLGPCIGQKYFEVGDEVREAFLAISTHLSSCFRPSQPDKWLANLTQIATILLNQQGVISISSVNQCTYKNNKKYYSYRRDKVTGRMASLICIM